MMLCLPYSGSCIAWVRAVLAPAVLLAGLAAATDVSADSAAEAGGRNLAPREVGAQLMARMALQPGEQVLIIAQPGRWNALVERLGVEIAAADADALGVIQVGEAPAPAGWSTAFTNALAGLSDQERVAALSGVDIAVMLPGARAHPAYAALQEVLRSGQGRTVHFHWEGAYELNGSIKPVDAGVDRLYLDALLETDYPELASRQREFEAAMRGGETRVTTPSGTDLRFRIGDRPVTRQDGNASAARAQAARNLIDREVELPAGVVRVAPLETTVNGTIAFPPTVWGGVEVRGLVLTIQSGRVIDVQADSGREAVLEELDAAGPAGRAFREFALGLNPKLAIPAQGEPWIPYYGYGAGVVRLSLGDNTELGGAVGGGYVRWNFFTHATVRTEGDVWVRDGVLVRP
ncbi:aminopeptidase [Elongatibacter sediminis]|uniref:Aminopeptidase n=1 Tax=Elongatibacter sediminis TaxID=3119006 RepID=A0AAW9RC05_9GAMM